tara:strand:- start:225760 stop:226071 length:312 start_codon:yes stop_codon:yes gene_type:complete
MKLQLASAVVLSFAAASSFAYPDSVIVNNFGSYAGAGAIDSEFKRIERQEPAKSQYRTLYQGDTLLDAVNERLSNGLNAALEQKIDAFAAQEGLSIRLAPAQQ